MTECMTVISKLPHRPIIKYADDAGQFKEAVVLQGVQLVASGLKLGPTRLAYTSDGETAGGMGLAIHLANGWRKKKKGARARTAGKDVLAVRNIWQGDDKPEKKELQFLDIYKVNADQSKRLQDKNMTFDKVIKPLLLPYVGNVDHAKLTMLRKFRERALLWNLEQKRTAKVKHESLNEQAMQSSGDAETGKFWTQSRPQNTPQPLMAADVQKMLTDAFKNNNKKKEKKN
eukprot:g52604.t1